MSTIELGQGCQKAVHKGIDTGMTSPIGDTGMIIMLTGQTAVKQSTNSIPADGHKLFLDKILYFDGSNNKEALNYLAQCKEAVEKMKPPETTVIWSKLARRADVVMREESRQHEGTVTWEVFQRMLIEHFYHILSKERAAKLLNKLQQDPHESIGEFVQRGSKIIQAHSGKTN